MKIILIRHCETDWNAQNRWQGHTDTDLNENGRRQALALADNLAHFGITRIFSSDLKRALQTADIISERLLITPVELDGRLRECAFGILEGLSWPEIEAKYEVKYIDGVRRLCDNGRVIYHNASESYDFSGYGGESRDQVLERHLALMEDLKNYHRSETPLIVGHGTGLNTLLAKLGQKPNLQREEYRALEV